MYYNVAYNVMLMWMHARVCSIKKCNVSHMFVSKTSKYLWCYSTGIGVQFLIEIKITAQDTSETVVFFGDPAGAPSQTPFPRIAWMFGENWKLNPIIYKKKLRAKPMRKEI